NDPPRRASDDIHDVVGLLSGAEDHVDDDIRFECADVSGSICDCPAIASDVPNGRRDKVGGTPAMEDGDLVIAANEIRDHPWTDEPGAADDENSHRCIDTETLLRVPSNFSPSPFQGHRHTSQPRGISFAS